MENFKFVGVAKASRLRIRRRDAAGTPSFKYFAADGGDRAGITFGRTRLACVAAMQQQVVVGVQQVLLRNAFQQRFFNAFDGRFGDESRAVGDTKDMRVNRQRRHAVTNVHDDIGRLASYARQCHQLFSCFGHFAVEIGQQLLADTDDRFRFVTPPLDVVKSFSDLVDGMLKELVNRANESRRLAELRDTLLPKLMSGELKVI